MKRFFCLLMSLMCLCLPAAHATGVDAEDYTVAGKLVKQLWAGAASAPPCRWRSRPRKARRR